MKTSDWLSNINERDICEERALCSATHTAPPALASLKYPSGDYIMEIRMFSHGSYCSLWGRARAVSLDQICRADKSDSCEPIPGPGSSAKCPLTGGG